MFLANIGGKATVKPKQNKEEKSKEEKLAEKKAKRELQIKQSKENRELGELETKIKKLKDDIVYRLQGLVEYKQNTIKEEDWTKIYILLDDTLLDEIFQERDALGVWCNLKCQRKLTMVHPNVGNLINLQWAENTKEDLLTEKVVEVKQNYFYWSPKWRTESNIVIHKVKEDLESYTFKELKHFKFLENYKESMDKYNELVSVINKFKELWNVLKIDRKRINQQEKFSWMNWTI